MIGGEKKEKLYNKKEKGTKNEQGHLHDSISG